tara:strand:+ start:1134 stop:1616 length:483 start_codon:yes stop_codon:yes gene_type:complete
MINITYLFIFYLLLILFFYLIKKLDLKYLIFLPLLLIISFYIIKNYIILKEIKNYRFQGKYILLDIFLIFLINNFKIIDYNTFINKLNIFLHKIENQELYLHSEKNDILNYFNILLTSNNIDKKYYKFFNDIIINIYDNYKIKLFNNNNHIASDMSTYTN